MPEALIVFQRTIEAAIFGSLFDNCRIMTFEFMHIKTTNIFKGARCAPLANEIFADTNFADRSSLLEASLGEARFGAQQELSRAGFGDFKYG